MDRVISSHRLEEPRPGRLSPAPCSFPLPALCLAAFMILQVSTDVAHLPTEFQMKPFTSPVGVLVPPCGYLWVHLLRIPSHVLQPSMIPRGLEPPCPSPQPTHPSGPRVFLEPGTAGAGPDPPLSFPTDGGEGEWVGVGLSLTQGIPPEPS